MHGRDGPRNLPSKKSSEITAFTYTLVRFSHQNRFVSYKEKELWKAVRDAENPLSHNADNTYWLFHEPFDSAVAPPEAR